LMTRDLNWYKGENRMGGAASLKANKGATRSCACVKPAFLAACPSQRIKGHTCTAAVECKIDWGPQLRGGVATLSKLFM
jgi:hypothetical protein